MNVRFHREASRDYHDALEFYRTADPALADDFIRKVEQAVSAISLHPLTYPRRDGTKRPCLLKRFPFGIYYTIEAEGHIVIWAVAHLSRQPDYWKSRKT